MTLTTTATPNNLSSPAVGIWTEDIHFVKHGHNLERLQSSRDRNGHRRDGGGQDIVAGQPTSSVASVTAPSEGGCMQSVPMSSSLRSTSWLGPPPPFHMASYTHGKPPSKAKTLSHLTSCLLHPPFITESRALAVQVVRLPPDSCSSTHSLNKHAACGVTT